MSVTPSTLEEALSALERSQVRAERLREACQNAKIRCRAALEDPSTTLATPLHASHRVADILTDLDQVWDTWPPYQGGPLREEIVYSS